MNVNATGWCCVSLLCRAAHFFLRYHIPEVPNPNHQPKTLQPDLG